VKKEKKIILLLAPPSKHICIRDNYCSYVSKSNYYWSPIDLLVQSGILGRYHNIIVIDSIARKYTKQECLHEISKIEFDIVIFITGVVSWKEDFDFIQRLKRLKKFVCFASGDFLLTHTEEIIKKYPYIDGALLNYTSDAILNYIKYPKRVIANLVHSFNGKTYVGKKVYPDKFVKIGKPLHNLFPLDSYEISTSLDTAFATIISSIGCNYQCPFCVCSIIPLRYREIEDLFDEIEYIKNMGVNELYFYDPNFTTDMERTTKICNLMIKNKYNLKWFCNGHVNHLNREVLYLMKKAGCHTIMLGLESGHNRVLRSIRKGFSTEKAAQIVRECHNIGIRTLGYFLIGLPGETNETINDTIRFAKSLPLDFASFNFPSPVPGTEMWKKHLDHKYSEFNKVEMDHSNDPVIDINGISKDKLTQFKTEAYRKFYLRPIIIYKQLISVKNFTRFLSHIRDGWALLKKNIINLAMKKNQEN